MTERLRRPLAIRSSGWGDLAILVGAFIGSGASIMTADAQSQALLTALPPTTIIWFSAAIALWSAVALSGVWPQFWDERRHKLAPTLAKALSLLHWRLRREQVGLIGFSGAALAYGYLIIGYAGSHGMTTALWVALFAVAFLGRSYEIRTDLKKLESIGDNPQMANPPAVGEPDNPRG